DGIRGFHVTGVQTCALPILGGLELDPLTLVEGTEARRLDRAVVDEHVRAAAVDLDEAEALLTVEPLHGSLCHDNLLAISRPHLRSEEHTSELQSRENIVCRL